MSIRPMSVLLFIAAGAFGNLAMADELESKLPSSPGGIGQPAANRQAWEPLASTPEGTKLIKQAESLLKQPMPAFVPDLYLEYYRNGNRTNFQNQNSKRWAQAGDNKIAPPITDLSKANFTASFILSTIFIFSKGIPTILSSV